MLNIRIFWTFSRFMVIFQDMNLCTFVKRCDKRNASRSCIFSIDLAPASFVFNELIGKFTFLCKLFSCVRARQAGAVPIKINLTFTLFLLKTR